MKFFDGLIVLLLLILDSVDFFRERIWFFRLFREFEEESRIFFRLLLVNRRIGDKNFLYGDRFFLFSFSCFFFLYVFL